MSKKPKQKVLSFKDIMKQADDIDKYSTYTVNEELNQVIKYNEKFSETKIEELITELFNHIQYDIDHEIGYFKNELHLNTYVNFLIIKHFTNLKEVISDSLEENIITIPKLRKLRYFTLMFSEVFDANEVNRITERLHTIALQADKLLTLNKQDITTLANNVQSNYYKNRIDNLAKSAELNG